MDSYRQRRRLRIPVPRWPSRDHRDFQTAGVLAAWRSRRSRPAAPEDSPNRLDPPPLTRIVRLHREDAALHVELAARSAVAHGRAPVAVRDAGAACAGARPDDPETAPEAAASWTVTLTLN